MRSGKRNDSSSKSLDSVKEVFYANFKNFDELGSAFCLMQDGQVLLDLKAGPVAVRSEKTWSDQTLVNIWSTTKGIVATCYCVLVSRGLISYQDNVSTYWPEFGVNNKAEITIGDLLSHKAGLAALHDGATCRELLSASAVDSLAKASPLWNPSQTSGYHILTFGPLVTELFRRIEGRSIKKYVEQEFLIGRGWDIHIGLPEEREADAAKIAVSETLDLSVRENASELQQRVLCNVCGTFSSRALTLAFTRVLNFTCIAISSKALLLFVVAFMAIDFDSQSSLLSFSSFSAQSSTSR